MARVNIEVPWEITENAAVDAVASLALKERHRRFGEVSRLIAQVVKPIYEANGRRYGWNALWTIATRVASVAMTDYADENVVRSVATAIAQKFNVPQNVAREIADGIWAIREDLMQYKK